MLFPFAFVCPLTYHTLAAHARFRHAMFGVSPELHRASMAFVYGVPW